MHWLGRFAAVLSVLVAFPIMAAAQITITHDDFEGVTVAKYEAKEVGKDRSSRGLGRIFGHGPSVFDHTLSWRVLGIRKDGGDVAAVVLSFISSDSVEYGWRYLDCHMVAAMMDGRPFPLAEAEHSGDVGDGYVLEHITVPVTMEQLRQLSGAKDVKLRVCNDVVGLSSQDLGALKTVIGALEPAVAPTSDFHAGSTPYLPPAVVPKDAATGKLKFGVVMGKNNEVAAKVLGMAEPKGVVVVSVVQDSVASAAGLLQGDALLKYGDAPVNQVEDLQQAIAATAPGRKIPITVWRAGRGLLVLQAEF